MGWLSRLFRRAPPVPPPRSRQAEPRTPPGRTAMQDVVGPRHVVTMDPECVDNARDYESVVADLAKIAGGALVYDRFECVDQADGRRLTLRRGDRVVGGVLSDGSWIDLKGLLAVLNDAVADGPARFATFDDGADDQSVSFAFLTREQADRLHGVVEIDGVKTLWKPEGRGAVPLFTHDSGELAEVALATSGNGSLIASAGGNEVRVYDLRSDTTRVLAVAGANAVAFDAKGELLVGTGAGVKRGDVTLGAREVMRLAVDRERTRLVVGARKGAFDRRQWVELWDLATNELVREWEVGTGTIHVAIAGDAIATAGENGDCIVWNADGTKRFEHPLKPPVWGVALSSDATQVAFGSEGGTIVVRSAIDGAEQKRYRRPPVWTMSFGPDDTLAVSGSDAITIVAPERKKLRVPDGIADIVCHAWLPDGTLAIATSTLDHRQLRIYLIGCD